MDESSADTMTTPVSPDAASPAVRITQSRAFSYRVPREVTTRGAKFNYVVLLTAERPDGTVVEAIGEGQPRGRKTGDETGASWPFLSEAMRQLHGWSLPSTEPEAATDAVRDQMSHFFDLADLFSVDPNIERPFRGTLLGIEVALLDLAARAVDMSLSDFLGRVRDAAPGVPRAVDLNGRRGSASSAARRSFSPLITAGTAAEDSSELEFGENVADEYQRVRVAARTRDAAVTEFLQLISMVDALRSDGQPDQPLWLEFTGGLGREEASDFVKSVAESVRRGDLPSHILMEQPGKVSDSDHLPVMQAEADEILRGAEGVKVMIMGDETVWDVASIEHLHAEGGIRAVNIRPAQAGGLLPSLDLARRAAALDPDVEVFLTRMVGASRVTSAALAHLALSLPVIHCANVRAVVESALPFTEFEGLDSEKITSTAAAPAVASSDGDQAEDGDEADEDEDEGEEDEDSDADPESGQWTSYDDDEEGTDEGDDQDRSLEDTGAAPRRTVRRMAAPGSTGTGMRLAPSALVGDIDNMVTYPAPPEVKYEGMNPTVYDDVDNLHPLGANGSKGHLLEREALALGLNSTRFSKGAFTVADGTHEAVSFKWSRNPLSSAVSLALCTHKEATRLQLQRSGIPVPQGRTFANGDFETARSFAARIGYPVVVKPAMGVRGIGVVANIQDEEQLDAAFDLMAGSKLGDQDFIVEKHVDGRDYRIVVIGDEVVAAILREPASVFGDGERTVAQLMIDKNVARRRNPHLWARPAKYDDAAKYELEKAGMTLDSVPEPGQRVQLANTCSLSQGGDSIDVLDELHPTILEACVKTVRAIPGLAYCGVDFLLEDHTKPLDEQDAGICELNAHAAIGNCEYPMYGTPRKVAETLMRATVDHYGFETFTERSDRVALRMTIRGRVTRVGYRSWLRRRALQSGVTGWVRNVNRKTVEAVLVGPTAATTALAASTILGPRRAIPTSYQAEHLEDPGLDGFDIVDEPLTELTPVGRR